MVSHKLGCLRDAGQSWKGQSWICWSCASGRLSLFGRAFVLLLFLGDFLQINASLGDQPKPAIKDTASSIRPGNDRLTCLSGVGSPRWFCACSFKPVVVTCSLSEPSARRPSSFGCQCLQNRSCGSLLGESALSQGILASRTWRTGAVLGFSWRDPRVTHGEYLNFRSSECQVAEE